MNKAITSAVAVMAAFFASNACATTISASEIASGSAGGISFFADGGSLATKTAIGVTAVGVTGGAGVNDEIDIPGGQRITAWSPGFVLGSLTLAFLYDGPEYGDVQEVAQIVGTFAGGGGSSTVTLTNLYRSANDTDSMLLVDGMQRNDLLLSTSEATASIASEIALGRLFGNNVITDLEFSALPGICGGVGTCDNQSDYGIERLIIVDNANDVPEPGAFGLAALAFILVGLGTRRRRLRA